MMNIDYYVYSIEQLLNSTLQVSVPLLCYGCSFLFQLIPFSFLHLCVTATLLRLLLILITVLQ